MIIQENGFLLGETDNYLEHIIITHDAKHDHAQVVATLVRNLELHIRHDWCKDNSNGRVADIHTLVLKEVNPDEIYSPKTIESRGGLGSARTRR